MTVHATEIQLATLPPTPPRLLHPPSPTLNNFPWPPLTFNRLPELHVHLNRSPPSLPENRHPPQKRAIPSLSLPWKRNRPHRTSDSLEFMVVFPQDADEGEGRVRWEGVQEETGWEEGLVGLGVGEDLRGDD
jgi:hypothetical protein